MIFQTLSKKILQNSTSDVISKWPTVADFLLKNNNNRTQRKINLRKYIRKNNIGLPFFH